VLIKLSESRTAGAIFRQKKPSARTAAPKY